MSQQETRMIQKTGGENEARYDVVLRHVPAHVTQFSMEKVGKYWQVSYPDPNLRVVKK